MARVVWSDDNDKVSTVMSDLFVVVLPVDKWLLLVKYIAAISEYILIVVYI